MFDKLKQIRQLKEIQDSLAKERIEIEKEGVRISINGSLNVEEINLNRELGKEKQERILKECFNDAIRQVQIKIAQKMPGIF